MFPTAFSPLLTPRSGHLFPLQCILDKENDGNDPTLSCPLRTATLMLRFNPFLSLSLLSLYIVVPALSCTLTLHCHLLSFGTLSLHFSVSVFDSKLSLFSVIPRLQQIPPILSIVPDTVCFLPLALYTPNPCHSDFTLPLSLYIHPHSSREPVALAKINAAT